MAKKKNIKFDDILKLHKQGLYDQEIAEILGCRRSNITKRLNQKGYGKSHSKINDIRTRNKISESLIGRYTGENNPNYKGYSDEKTLARGIFKTLSKRKIRENKYTCKCCQKIGGDMVTHHIKPFSLIFENFIKNIYSGDISKLYDEITKYSEFTDENNLVVLCKSCHKNVHYSDNPELSPYRWENATTIENK